MLDALRFVQGAVAKKDFVQALTHFRIKDGTVMGHNGGLTLSAPIDLDLDVVPKAVSFVKAIQTCTETISLGLTAAGRLSVRSGKFRAYVECLPDGFPDITPEGETVAFKPGIVKALKLLEPFIGEDASRPWARGVLFRGQSAFATNNVILVEHWLGYDFPRQINIPQKAIAEMIRIGDDPTHMQVAENSVTFFYEGDRWLKTQLYSLDWPDLGKVLSRPANPIEPPVGLWDAVESLAPFTDKLRRVFLSEGVVTTVQTEGDGASIDVPALKTRGIYNVDYLLEVAKVAQVIDLAGYPGPAMFFGEGIRGAIIGMRG